MKLRTFFAAAAVAAALAAAPAAAYETELEKPSAEAMTFDLFIVRPLTLAGALAGIAVFVVALPISVVSGNVADPARALVIEPLQYTFTRELGDLR